MNVPHHPIADQLAWLAVQPIDTLTRDACLTHLEKLGRTTRLANRVQRRLPRALHPTCIIPR